MPIHVYKYVYVYNEDQLAMRNGENERAIKYITEEKLLT